MAELTPRGRRGLLAVGALYAVAVALIGIHQGGDLAVELAQAKQMLHGAPLYQGVDTVRGLPWPPFAVFCLMPFALLAQLSLPLVKGLWAVGNVALFGWCIARGFDWSDGRWWPVVFAVASVAQPLQSNFQHLNINIVLLGFVVLAIEDLRRERHLRAAVWIAVATALKGYPGPIFLYFLARGHWRALAAGIALTAALTLVAGLPYGIAAAPSVAVTYVQMSLGAPSTHALGGQPLGSLVARLGGSPAVALALDLCAIGAVVLALRRTRNPLEPAQGLALTAVLALLLAPLDRLHFYVLAFPAWVKTFALPAPVRGRIAWGVTLTVAGLLTSGMLTFHGLLPAVLWVIARNSYILGSLLLLGINVLPLSSRTAARESVA